MPRFIVEGVTADKDGIFEVPERYVTIGAFYHPQTGVLNLVVMIEAPMITPVPGPKTSEGDKKPDA